MPNYVGRKQTIKNYAAIWGTETGGHRSAESLKATFPADFRKTRLVLNVRTMNPTKFNSWLLGLALMAAATANFTSCKEDDNGDDTKATDCETILFGSGDSHVNQKYVFQTFNSHVEDINHYNPFAYMQLIVKRVISIYRQRTLKNFPC